VIALALCGMGVAAGLVLAFLALSPARPSLEAELARLARSAPAPAAPPASRDRYARLRRSLGSALAEPLGAAGLVPAGLDADLQILEQDRADWAAQVGVATAGLGATVVVLLALFAVVVGFVVPIFLVLATLVVVAGLSWLVPTVSARAAARGRRDHFRAVLATWLELVTLSQAAGTGLEGAMDAACSLADDWALRRLGRALANARHLGLAPWEGLRQLGAELGVDELGQIAAMLTLAGSEGARVRASLAAGAASLRGRQLATTEAEANRVSERLFLPATVIMIAFLLFLTFPAFERILASL
jgi:Flp pilus assembly protein TadB